MEAEYVALSQSVRDLIPLRRMTTLVCDAIFGKGKYQARMYSQVFEDNNGALQLARACRITLFKHYGIKYHFFKDYVKKGDLKLFKVESINQRADIFIIVYYLWVGDTRTRGSVRTDTLVNLSDGTDGTQPSQFQRNNP
jgi:hypothetical protein